MDNVILIGYSGHSYVVADILLQQGCTIAGYMESAAKNMNPFQLQFLGSENDEHSYEILFANKFTVAIGNNLVRRKVYTFLEGRSLNSFSAIHPKSIIASLVTIGEGVTIMAGTIINPLANVGKGVILNTGVVIEHECNIDEFAHIAPAVILAGNVSIGANTFIGANSTIREGIKVGNNVIVGAGSVIVKNIPDNAVVYGNPGRTKK